MVDLGEVRGRNGNEYDQNVSYASVKCSKNRNYKHYTHEGRGYAHFPVLSVHLKPMQTLLRSLHSSVF